MSMWWCLQLRREAASVPLARRLLRDAMDRAGVDRDVSYEMGLALSEACANAVEHGGSGAVTGAADRGEAYCVTAYLDGDLCSIEVADAGPGFCGKGAVRPSARPPEAESGRGLFLIQALADRVRVSNRPGRGGAVVTFDRTLTWREPHRDGDGSASSLLRAG
jgi:serine/threonine-protein kinase RsbW